MLPAPEMHTMPRFACDEACITIKTTDDTDRKPLQAPALLLRYHSSVCYGLPQECSEWDLTNLLIEGRPVERTAVVAWLNCVYQHDRGQPFQEQQPAYASTSAAELHRLLALADAVGSSTQPLHHALANLKQLQLTAQLGSGSLQLVMGEGDMFGVPFRPPCPRCHVTCFRATAEKLETSNGIRQLFSNGSSSGWKGHKAVVAHPITLDDGFWRMSLCDPVPPDLQQLLLICICICICICTYLYLYLLDIKH